MLKKLFLTILLIAYSTSGWCAVSDFFSRDWWVSKSGISTGTINDIKYQYLGSLGYTGTLNDRVYAWLIDVTGYTAPASMSGMIYQCFGQTTLCNDYSPGGGVTNQLAFLGDTITYLGDAVAYNP